MSRHKWLQTMFDPPSTSQGLPCKACIKKQEYCRYSQPRFARGLPRENNHGYRVVYESYAYGHALGTTCIVWSKDIQHVLYLVEPNLNCRSTEPDIFLFFSSFFFFLYYLHHSFQVSFKLWAGSEGCYCCCEEGSSPGCKRCIRVGVLVHVL